MIRFSILRVTTLQWCLVYGTFQNNRENKKKKLRKNGNIYSTPVFWQNRFNFVVIIQKLNNWRYLKELKCLSKMYTRNFYTFLHFQNILAIFVIFIYKFEIWNFLTKIRCLVFLWTLRFNKIKTIFKYFIVKKNHKILILKSINFDILLKYSL